MTVQALPRRSILCVILSIDIFLSFFWQEGETLHGIVGKADAFPEKSRVPLSSFTFAHEEVAQSQCVVVTVATMAVKFLFLLYPILDDVDGFLSVNHFFAHVAKASLFFYSLTIHDNAIGSPQVLCQRRWRRLPSAVVNPRDACLRFFMDGIS